MANYALFSRISDDDKSRPAPTAVNPLALLMVTNHNIEVTIMW